jgi:hypothetical protein
VDEVRFVRPLECHTIDEVRVDRALLDALVAIDGDVRERLMLVLPYVRLANSDSTTMLTLSEALLMASAFDVLLDADGKAYNLSKAFGELMQPFGSVRVSDLLNVRSGLHLERREDELKWFAHRAWIRELYQLRNKATHAATTVTREWAWTVYEHLLMAAYVFPLVVKLLCEEQGKYVLTDNDVVALMAIDRLLLARDWDSDVTVRVSKQSGHQIKNWQQVLGNVRSDRRVEAAAADWAARKKTARQLDDDTSV